MTTLREFRAATMDALCVNPFNLTDEQIAANNARHSDESDDFPLGWDERDAVI